jgi:hypothetical protein
MVSVPNNTLRSLAANSVLPNKPIEAAMRPVLSSPGEWK